MLTQIVCPHGRIQTHIRKAVFTTLFLSGMSAIFGQDKISEKNTLQKNTTTTLPNDSVDIGGFRVSSDEAKIYEGFLANRGQYETEEIMINQYIKKIGKDRRRRDLMQKLDDAERANAQKKEVIATEDKTNTQKKEVIATEDKTNTQKKEVIATKRKEGEEFDKTIEQLKQQLSSISKLTIEESKYAPFLLKEKGEGEATGEDEKLNGTLLGGALTNETYAKLTYLSVALDDEKIKDEQ